MRLMNKEKTRILAQLDSFRVMHPGPFWASLGVACVSMFGMVAAFGTSPSTVEVSIAQQAVVEQLAPTLTLTAQQDDAYFVRETRIQRGDTLASLLARLDIQDDEAFSFLRSNRNSQAIFRQLRPGKSVTAHISGEGSLLSLIYPLNNTERALFVERRNGQLQAREQSMPLDKEMQMKSGQIRSSLFGATDDAGIPDGIAQQLVEIFGGQIDFHRDLRRNDRFSVIYENMTHLGKPVRSGRLLAAEFTNAGKTFQAVWFQDGKNGSYYTPEGKSLKAAFLRSPLEFSRISSHFTKARFHPIHKTWRAHKGTDYAAPTGTRVKATADGVVDFVGKQNGFGNIVVLRHQQRYTTAYAHLSRFASGLKRGDRISQGQIIGFVGSTGWATGPHLHYEFRINGVQQNPLSVALPTVQPLGKVQQARLRDQSRGYLTQLKLLQSNRLAQLD